MSGYGPASDSSLKEKKQSYGPGSSSSSSSKTSSYGPASDSSSSSKTSSYGPASSGSSSKSSSSSGPASSPGTSTPKVYDKSNMDEKMYNDFLAMNATLYNPVSSSKGGSSSSGYGSLGKPTSDTYYSSMAKDAIAKGDVNAMYDLLGELEGVDKSVLTDVQKSSLFSAKKKINEKLKKMDSDGYGGFGDFGDYGDFMSEIQDYISQMFGAAKGQTIPDSVWQKLNASYEMSDTVKQAYETTAKYLNQLSSGKTPYTDKMNQYAEQLAGGKTPYTDKLNGLIDNYRNKDPFSYNPDEDALFQNALSSAMRNGQTAMQDTMGQAAALTGGYGSSYATTAANNVYNQYINEAYDNLPQFYQMAMQAYGLEDERLLNEINLVATQDAQAYDRLGQAFNTYATLDSKEYEKLYNTWNANAQTANDLYSKEYNEFLGNLNQYQQNAGLILQSNAQQWDMMQGATSAALQLGNMYQQNYWNNKDYELSLQKAQQQADEFEAEMDYKYAALFQDQEQFRQQLELKQLAAASGGSGGSGGSRGGGGGYNTTKGNMSQSALTKLYGEIDKCKSWEDIDRLLAKYDLNEVDLDKIYGYIDGYVSFATEDTKKTVPVTSDNIINSRMTTIKNNVQAAETPNKVKTTGAPLANPGTSTTTNSSKINDYSWMLKNRLTLK